MSINRLNSGGFSEFVMSNLSNNNHNNSSFKMIKAESTNEELKTPRVNVRIRPLLFNELERVVEEKGMDIMNYVNESSLVLDKESESFKMEKVFNSNISQSKFYEEFVKESVSEVIALGETRAFIFFGEKGTGKTYSLLGGLSESESFGALVRATREIFSYFETTKIEAGVHMSISEIDVEEEREKVKLSKLTILNYAHFFEIINFYNESIQRENSCISLEVIRKSELDNLMGKLLFVKLNGNDEFRNLMILEKNRGFIARNFLNLTSAVNILLTCSGYSESIDQTKLSLNLAEKYKRKRKCLKNEKNDEKDKKIKELEFDLSECRDKLLVYQEAWNLKSQKENFQSLGVGSSSIINECFSS